MKNEKNVLDMSHGDMCCHWNSSILFSEFHLLQKKIYNKIKYIVD